MVRLGSKHVIWSPLWFFATAINIMLKEFKVVWSFKISREKSTVCDGWMFQFSCLTSLLSPQNSGASISFLLRVGRFKNANLNRILTQLPCTFLRMNCRSLNRNCLVGPLQPTIPVSNQIWLKMIILLPFNYSNHKSHLHTTKSLIENPTFLTAMKYQSLLDMMEMSQILMWCQAFLCQLSLAFTLGRIIHRNRGGLYSLTKVTAWQQSHLIGS